MFHLQSFYISCWQLFGARKEKKIAKFSNSFFFLYTLDIYSASIYYEFLRHDKNKLTLSYIKKFSSTFYPHLWFMWLFPFFTGNLFRNWFYKCEFFFYVAGKFLFYWIRFMYVCCVIFRSWVRNSGNLYFFCFCSVNCIW